MSKKLFIIISLGALILSSCGMLSPTQAVTATPAETQTAEPTVTLMAQPTDTPVAVATTEVTPQNAAATNTPEARPTNDPNCTNSATFVADITIPDNTPIDPGAAFTKTWRISNSGTCIWASDYKLTYYSEERMGAPDSIPLSLTYPGQTIDISLNLTAPTSAGAHRGNFVIKNPEGLIMKISDDSRLWFIINVTNNAAVPTVTTAPVATVTSAPAATLLPTNTQASSSSGTGGTCAFSADTNKVTEAINAINAYRTQNGLAVYNIKDALTKAAQAHANDMACNNLTGHTGSNGSTPGSRIAQNGYGAAYSSENVYFSNPPVSGQDAVNWWINDTTDPHHKLNIVSDTFIDAGVGYAFFNNNGYYVVVFATP